MCNMVAALAALGLAFSAPSVLAQGKEVKVGLIAPLSGPWARQGDLMLKGAQMAIDDINNDLETNMQRSSRWEWRRASDDPSRRARGLAACGGNVTYR